MKGWTKLKQDFGFVEYSWFVESLVGYRIVGRYF